MKLIADRSADAAPAALVLAPRYYNPQDVLPVLEADDKIHEFYDRYFGGLSVYNPLRGRKDIPHEDSRSDKA